MTTVPAKCQPLATDLENKKELLADLRSELATAQGQERSRLLWLVKEAAAAVGQATAKLQTCIDPPPPLPNLKPTDVVIRFHPELDEFDATLLILNDGAGPALRSFKIVFGFEYYTFNQDPPLLTYHERNAVVPAPVDIQPGATYRFTFNDIAFVARPGSAMASYTFYALVDSENQIKETMEGDNNLQMVKVIKVPLIAPVIPVGSAAILQ